VTDLDFGSIDRYIVARGVLRVSTGASQRFMHQNSSVFDLRKCLKEATKAMSENCVARHEAFGTAGNAFKLRSLDLEEMVKRYDNGELDPRVN
jgi:fructose-bisphosphate aldolase, class II